MRKQYVFFSKSLSVKLLSLYCLDGQTASGGCTVSPLWTNAFSSDDYHYWKIGASQGKTKYKVILDLRQVAKVALEHLFSCL